MCVQKKDSPVIHHKKWFFAVLSPFLLGLFAFAVPGQPISAGGSGPTPIGGIVYDTPDFTWVGFAGTTYYQLEVTVEGEVVIKEWRTAEALGCDEFLNCYFENDTSLLVKLVGDNVSSWRWRSYNETDGVGEWSETYIFTILAPQILDVSAVTPSFPHDYEIEFISNENNFVSPDLYRLYVRRLGSSSPLFNIWVPADRCGATCYLQNYDTPRLSNGTYEAWIQGYTFFGGFSAWSPRFEFTINTAVTAPGTSFFATATNSGISGLDICQDDPDGTGVLCNTPILWPIVDVSGVSGLVEYIQLEIREENGPVVFSQWIPLTGDHPYCRANSSDVINTCMFRIPYTFEQGGAYTWRVRVWDDILGISAWTVPGGAGDPNDVTRVEITQPL